jgi:hypothetical protein
MGSDLESCSASQGKIQDLTPAVVTSRQGLRTQSYVMRGRMHVHAGARIPLTYDCVRNP